MIAFASWAVDWWRESWNELAERVIAFVWLALAQRIGGTA